MENIFKLTKIVEDGQGDDRISGNGSFPAPTEKDIGREVFVKRQCITWDGCLGYFLDDASKETVAFWNEELERI